jgi:hypothetical protein
MSPSKRYRPRVGDSRWFVEWNEEIVLDESGDIDRDATEAKEKTRSFKTREEAEAFAAEVWPKTHNAFGIVVYYPAEFVAYDEDDAARYPHVGYWEGTADTEVYEGPAEQEGGAHVTP